MLLDKKYHVVTDGGCKVDRVAPLFHQVEEEDSMAQVDLK